MSMPRQDSFFLLSASFLSLSLSFSSQASRHGGEKVREAERRSARRRGRWRRRLSHAKRSRAAPLIHGPHGCRVDAFRRPWWTWHNVRLRDARAIPRFHLYPTLLRKTMTVIDAKHSFRAPPPRAGRLRRPPATRLPAFPYPRSALHLLTLRERRRRRRRESIFPRAHRRRLHPAHPPRLRSSHSPVAPASLPLTGATTTTDRRESTFSGRRPHRSPHAGLLPAPSTQDLLHLPHATIDGHLSVRHASSPPPHRPIPHLAFSREHFSTIL